MCGKILAILFILIAIALAAAASVLPADKLNYVIMVSRFFDVMLPILAVGALLKYLCTCAKKCCCGKVCTNGKMDSSQVH